MINIPMVIVGDKLEPSSPIPESAIRVYIIGNTCTVYEEGDELPPEPVYEETPE